MDKVAMQPDAGLAAWAARWRTLVEKGNIGSAFPTEGADPFAGLAERFEARMRDDQAAADPLLPIVLPFARDARVIDVGAGVGRFTLPLAEVAREVVAVEPSPAMRTRLERHVRQRGAAHVRIVAAPFEAAELEPADLVLAAHVLHLVPDGPAFIRRVDALARGSVALVIRHDSLQAPLLEVWPRYRNDPPPRQAAFADLYNLLLAMGYAPNVSFYRRRYQPPVADLAEAQAWLSRAVGTEVSEADTRRALDHAPAYLREACIWWLKA